MRKATTILLSTILSASLFAQQPQTGEQSRREVKWVNPEIADMPGLSHHILQSKNLGHDVGYVVWIPEDYSEKSKNRYPVIYFLHGSGGNESKDAAGFSDWVMKAIDQGIIPPVICVFPNGGMSGYRGEVEKMMVDELIPLVDKSYRTVPKARSRLLAGFSMGGAGSVYLAIQHPRIFGAAGSMGGGLRNSNDELTQAISAAIPVWKKNKFRFFMVNGDNDRPEAFISFSELLNKEGIVNKVVILPDTKHNLGLYYERSVIDLIAFIGQNLKK
jgi:enterochelin esterase-like enzyme